MFAETLKFWALTHWFICLCYLLYNVLSVIQYAICYTMCYLLYIVLSVIQYAICYTMSYLLYNVLPVIQYAIWHICSKCMLLQRRLQQLHEQHRAEVQGIQQARFQEIQRMQQHAQQLNEVRSPSSSYSYFINWDIDSNWSTSYVFFVSY